MFVEDLSVFMSVNEFATPATLDWEPVSGIFDAPYAQPGIGGYGMESSAPAFTLASASVPASVVGKKLLIGADTADTSAVAYIVVATEPDGTGITRLILRT